MIVSHISSPHGDRILDPCAGKGVALATMATALKLEAYGVELNQERAINATDQIQKLACRQDLPTLIWMGTEYSVYTVMQASRRSWRIGQDRPVKVYFFNYADTLQNEALYLIAAKVAATVRVNGDVVGDDSLAELDELASTDMVTALARIVTEDQKHQVKGLNDVFAEANAEMKSANDYIGAFEMPDEKQSEPIPELANQVSRPQITVRRARIEVTPDDHFVAIPINVHNNTEQNGASKANGKIPAIESDEDPSTVPRPRLVFGQTKPSQKKARKRRSSKGDGRNLSLFDALS